MPAAMIRYILFVIEVIATIDKRQMFVNEPEINCVTDTKNDIILSRLDICEHNRSEFFLLNIAF